MQQHAEHVQHLAAIIGCPSQLRLCPFSVRHPPMVSTSSNLMVLPQCTTHYFTVPPWWWRGQGGWEDKNWHTPTLPHAVISVASPRGAPPMHTWASTVKHSSHCKSSPGRLTWKGSTQSHTGPCSANWSSHLYPARFPLAALPAHNISNLDDWNSEWTCIDKYISTHCKPTMCNGMHCIALYWANWYWVNTCVADSRSLCKVSTV